MKSILQSTQEQAAAAWINTLKQMRIDTMLQDFLKQDLNLESALFSLSNAKTRIVEEIIDRNRGGTKGMHGYIAEAWEVGIGNARKIIYGEAANHIWVNDNHATDIIRDSVNIQQKFVQSDKFWGISAIKEHLETYPDFVKNGGIYQIPKDFYESLIYLYNMPEEEAAKLVGGVSGSMYSYEKWKRVQRFFKDIKELYPEMDLTKIEPSLIEYDDSKAGKVNQILHREKKKIRNTDNKIRDEIEERTKPTVKEGTTTTAVSAALEGGIAFCMTIAQKRKQGKHLAEFTYEDWKELGIDTGVGTAKGAIRGGSVYALTNFTETPANVATALMTALFGITAQANSLRKKQISEEEFLINSETLCLDVTISAISSLLGQTLIPCPVLGAIIGNTVGMFMYEIAKDLGLQHEMKLISNYQKEISYLQDKLDAQYKQYVEMLEAEFKKFTSLIDMAFDPNVNKAFSGSIELARYAGVPESKILKSKADIDAFFTGTT